MTVTKDERLQALQRAVNAAMERAVAWRLARSNEVSAQRLAQFRAAMNGVATSDEERADFCLQAVAMADDVVERNWNVIEPAIRGSGGVASLALHEWPIDLIEEPLRPAGSSGAWTTYGTMLRHRVAHGIVACALTGRPAHVGFSSWDYEGQLTLVDYVQALEAGPMCDSQPAARPDDDDPCDCHEHSLAATVAALGLNIPPEADAEAWVQRMQRSPQVLEFKHQQHSSAGKILVRSLASGLLDAEALRLHEAGRITIDPVAVAAALNNHGWGASRIH